MKLSVHHATTYRYAEPVARSTQYIRMTPVTNNRQRVLEWQLDLPSRSIQFVDAFGNLTNLMTLSRSHDSISIVAHRDGRGARRGRRRAGGPGQSARVPAGHRPDRTRRCDHRVLRADAKGRRSPAADRRHRPDVGGPAGAAPDAGNHRCRNHGRAGLRALRAARSRIRCTCSSPAAAASVCRHAT